MNIINAAIFLPPNIAIWEVFYYQNRAMMSFYSQEEL